MLIRFRLILKAEFGDDFLLGHISATFKVNARGKFIFVSFFGE